MFKWAEFDLLWTGEYTLMKILYMIYMHALKPWLYMCKRSKHNPLKNLCAYRIEAAFCTILYASRIETLFCKDLNTIKSEALFYNNQVSDDWGVTADGQSFAVQ